MESRPRRTLPPTHPLPDISAPFHPSLEIIGRCRRSFDTGGRSARPSRFQRRHSIAAQPSCSRTRAFRGEAPREEKGEKGKERGGNDIPGLTPQVPASPLDALERNPWRRVSASLVGEGRRLAQEKTPGTFSSTWDLLPPSFPVQRSSLDAATERSHLMCSGCRGQSEALGAQATRPCDGRPNQVERRPRDRVAFRSQPSAPRLRPRGADLQTTTPTPCMNCNCSRKEKDEKRETSSHARRAPSLWPPSCLCALVVN